MSFYRFVAAGAVCVAVSMASSAQAALHFSQADLLSMTIDHDLTYGWSAATTGSGLTDDVNYNYGNDTRTMTGLAGASGTLDPGNIISGPATNINGDPIPAFFTGLGYSATAFYALGAAELAALNAAAAGDSILDVMGWNDNDDSWIVGIWAVDTTWPGGGVGSGTLDGLHLVAGNGGALSLDLASIGAPLARAGVFIALPTGSANDTYHASFGVPEPMTFVVWSALGAIGFLAYRRRQLA